VFYSEGPGYWTHLGPLIECLTQRHRMPVVYLTSEDNDPLLSTPPEQVAPFYIGDQSVRTMLFRTLDVGVLVMTMPDLETFHIKRSLHPVHYVYVHHSIVSTHMVYRPGAFDHFDTIFCVGPHHVEETRAAEKLYGLPAKTLFEHGYGRLEQIMVEAVTRQHSRHAAAHGPHVLIAPSWGPQAMLETCGHAFVGALLDAGFVVTVRPHPQTRRFKPAVLDALTADFGSHPAFRLEEDVGSRDSLFAADVMLSDWSGAALEFAFGLEKPVLFVDVPRKINNPEYERLQIEPLEVAIRTDIGGIVSPHDPQAAVAAVRCLVEQGVKYRERILAARQRYVFNLGDSAERGAAYLMGLLDAKAP
jgi:YidC/Oxa1 family membrane protein insertase